MKGLCGVKARAVLSSHRRRRFFRQTPPRAALLQAEVPLAVHGVFVNLLSQNSRLAFAASVTHVRPWQGV
jgi:hypothetical protein